MQDCEATLAQMAEDVARLSAKHHSTHRLQEDSQKTLIKNEAEAERAREAVTGSKAALAKSVLDFEAANVAQTAAIDASAASEEALIKADDARNEAQSREADARAERSEAEGEANALRAEVGALAKLVERDTAEGGQVLDAVRVKAGYEKALGAALADDLRAPEVGLDAVSGWAVLPAYLRRAIPARGDQCPDKLRDRSRGFGAAHGAGRVG